MVGADSGGKGSTATGAERGEDSPNPTLTLQAEGVVRRKTGRAVETAPRIQHGERGPSRGAKPMQPRLSATLLHAFDCPLLSARVVSEKSLKALFWGWRSYIGCCTVAYIFSVLPQESEHRTRRWRSLSVTGKMSPFSSNILPEPQAISCQTEPGAGQ